MTKHGRTRRNICKLSHIMHTLEAFQRGKYKNEVIQLEHLCFSMKTDGQKLYVMLNQSSEPRRSLVSIVSHSSRFRRVEMSISRYCAER